jgi:hypothetical protein
MCGKYVENVHLSTKYCEECKKKRTSYNIYLLLKEDIKRLIANDKCTYECKLKKALIKRIKMSKKDYLKFKYG